MSRTQTVRRLGSIALMLSSCAIAVGASRPSPALAISPLKVPVFSQKDDGNGNEWGPLGTCGSSIAVEGCYVTSRAMLYNYFQPDFTNPRDLNECLTSVGAYDAVCAVTKETYPQCRPQSMRPGYEYQRYDGIDSEDWWDLIYAHLAQGFPVLVSKHANSSSGRHMVVVTGLIGNTVYYNDPLNGERLSTSRYSPDFSPIGAFFYEGTASCTGSSRVRLRVRLEGRSDSRTSLRVWLRPRHSPESEAKFYSVPTNSDGWTPFIEEDLSCDTYTATVDADGYLSQSRDFPVRTNGTLDVEVGTLLAGDTVDDEVVNAMDYSLVVSDLMTSSGRSDIDGNGVVNTVDLAYVIENYTSRGVADARSEARHSAAVGIGSGTASIEVDRRTAAVGEVVTADIWIVSPSETLQAVNLDMRFDPGVFRYVSYKKGRDFETTEVEAADASAGLLRLSGLNDPGSSTAAGRHLVASVSLRVVASSLVSQLELIQSSGATNESNLVGARSNTDVLQTVDGATLMLSGAPARRAPSGRFVEPGPPQRVRYGAWVTEGAVWAGVQQFSVEASDPFDQVGSVRFEVHYDGSWHDVGTDYDGRDGWTAVWNPVIGYTVDPAWGGQMPVYPETFRVRATIGVRGSSVASTIETAEYEFYSHWMAPGILDVTLRDGADIGAVAGRYGSRPDRDVEGEHPRYWVRLPSISTNHDTMRMADVIWSDPDVVHVYPLIAMQFGDAGSFDDSVVALLPGWNMVALSSDPADGDVMDLFGEARRLVDHAFAYDGSKSSDPWLHYIAGASPKLQEFTASTSSLAMWVHATGSSVIGRQPPIDAGDLEVDSGWNLAELAAGGAVAPDEVRRRATGVLESIHYYSTSEGGWLQFGSVEPATLSILRPGRAYWVRMRGSGTIPQMRSGPQSDVTDAAASSVDQAGDPPVPTLPMTVYGRVADLKGIPLPSGSVSAWGDGGQIGTTRLETEDGAAVFAIDLAGDIPGTAPVEGARDGEVVEFRIGSVDANEAIVWRSGELANLDLTIGEPLAVSTATATNVSPTPSRSPGHGSPSATALVGTGTPAPSRQPRTAYLPMCTTRLSHAASTNTPESLATRASSTSTSTATSSRTASPTPWDATRESTAHPTGATATRESTPTRTLRPPATVAETATHSATSPGTQEPTPESTPTADGRTRVQLEFQDFEGDVFPPAGWRRVDVIAGKRAIVPQILWSRETCDLHPTRGDAAAAWSLGDGAVGGGLRCGSGYSGEVDTWLVYDKLNLTEYAGGLQLSFDYKIAARHGGTFKVVIDSDRRIDRWRSTVANTEWRRFGPIISSGAGRSSRTDVFITYVDLEPEGTHSGVFIDNVLIEGIVEEATPTPTRTRAPTRTRSAESADG